MSRSSEATASTDADGSEVSGMKRVNVLGTRVMGCSFLGAQEYLAIHVMERSPVIMSAATVYSVMLGRRMSDFRAKVNRAPFIMADGMPLVWAQRLFGTASERVHGDDLMLACCKRFPLWRHFLLGGAVDQPEKVVQGLIKRVPGIQIVGAIATPERPVPPLDTERIVALIEHTRADVVWVGMGTPAQDEWMSENSASVGVPMVGVGSAFDMLAGRTSSAPEWIKRSGLQWLFRLVQEPRRLAPRYLIYNPLFVWHLALQYVGLKTY